jgi:hypothetical protein
MIQPNKATKMEIDLQSIVLNIKKEVKVKLTILPSFLASSNFCSQDSLVVISVTFPEANSTC